jgi:O-antigen/teichoic acid export membrane protein
MQPSNEHAIPKLDAQGLRKFGFTTGGIVAVLFGLAFPLLLGRDWPIWPWIVLAVLAIPAVVMPAVLDPVYRGWMKFGLLASKVTTPLILGSVFYLLIFPLGIVRGALGKNDMRRPFRRAAESYRVPSRRNPVANLEKPF